ncbi:MAG: hypothetical protein R3E40_02085 [Rhodocyclaceae bacterium]
MRSGKWQIMINGESYKWIDAEAAKKALGLDRIQERVFIVKLKNDKNDPSRIAGAVGFSVRENRIYVQGQGHHAGRRRLRTCSVRVRWARARAAPVPGGTPARPTPWLPRPVPS